MIEHVSQLAASIKGVIERVQVPLFPCVGISAGVVVHPADFSQYVTDEVAQSHVARLSGLNVHSSLRAGLDNRTMAEPLGAGNGTERGGEA